jgi:alkylation response protein AidB-like acyl-CoA dehydrogenase
MAGHDEPDRAAGRQRPGPGAHRAATLGPANGVPVRVSGHKIFISGGDQDLTDNIVHLVLCRLPTHRPARRACRWPSCPSPAGRPAQRGVLRRHREEDGHQGQRHLPDALRAAPTGWLVGEPHRGLAAMFLMMNSARLHVAMQGLGHLEAATQNAWAYASERLQMRAARRPAGAAGSAGRPHRLAPGDAPAAADAAGPHRRLPAGGLFHGAAAGRIAEQHPDARAAGLPPTHVALLTPVAKASSPTWATAAPTRRCRPGAATASCTTTASSRPCATAASP